MTLTQLRYVIAAADTGSMNEAAKKLFISQPSLSQALRELEKEIGIEIFLRNNRGVILTEEGKEFLGYARQVTEQYELMEPNMAHIRYVGSDGNIYSEYHDFLNDTYELDEGETEETIESDTWPTSDLAGMMPQMEAAAIAVEHDDEESFEVLAYGVTEDDFNSYIEQCREAGFDTVEDESSMDCTLRNADGYAIDITYYRAYDYFYSEILPPEV